MMSSAGQNRAKASLGDDEPWYGALEFRTLAENVPALLFVSNKAGLNIYTNATYQRYSGRRADELLGTGYLDILHPDDRTRAVNLWRKINVSSEPYEIEHRFRKHDGEYRWHNVRGVPVLDGDGNPVRWIGICTDIQDLRNAVEEAADTKELLAVIGRSTDALVFAKDAEGRFEFANEATLEALEASVEDVLGRSVSDTGRNPTEAKSVDDNDARVLRERQMLVIEEQWTTSAGVKRTYRSTKGPWMRSDGSVGIVGITTDITREKDLAEDLAQQRHSYRNLIDNLPFVLWLTDAEGRPIIRNNLWQSYTGLPDTNAQPLTLADLVDPSEYENFRKRWQLCITEGDMLDTTVLLRDALLGRSVEHRIVAIPVRDRAGRLSGWVGSAVPTQST